MPTKGWGAPIELDSSDKADFYLESYETAVATLPGQVLGSYAFMWGQKQERTPTWYGMFLADGSETEAVGMRDSSATSTGGDPEEVPEAFPELVANAAGGNANYSPEPSSE